jgi:hypothetical protein
VDYIYAKLRDGYMKKNFLVIISLLIIAFICPFANAADNLLTASDITYIGSFKVPHGKNGGVQDAGLGWGGEAIAYNPTNNSLFISGHAYDNYVGEISIPTPIISDNLAKLNTASMLQNLYNVTEGHLSHLEQGGGSYGGEVRIGGLIKNGSKLVGSTYIYYDGSDKAYLSHWSSGLKLSSTGDFLGNYRLSGTQGASFVAGYMTDIPSAYQSTLGGTHLTGSCCLSIITRTSWGPAVSVFNAADVGVVNPIPSTTLMYYDESHPTLGYYGDAAPNIYFNGTTRIRGIIFPPGSRSVLFIGENGIGSYCYGTGSACGDPTNDYQGNHAYPYRFQIWAYDVNDLIAVKNGTKLPWHPTPYAIIPLPRQSGLPDVSGVTGGSAYDPATQRLYFVDWTAEGNGYPLIHVYSINVSSTPTLKIPSPPSNLQVVIPN